MKKKLIRACALFSCLLLCTACTDTIFSSMFGGDNVAIEIDLNIPGESSAATRALKTRAGGENQYDNHTDENTALQRYIGDGDYYVLIFEKSEDSGSDWVLYAVPDISSFSGDNGDATRTLTAVMKKPDGNKTIIVDVVTNLVENGVYTSTSEAKSTLTGMLGQSRENVYAAIGSFTCPENSEDNPYGVWNLDETNGGRYLPMWGQSYNSSSTSLALQTYDITPSTSELDVTCGLYRSVAKIGVTVDESCQTFQLKEIYVYYPNNQGTFVSLPVENTNWTPSKEVQFTLPEVPEDATSRDIAYPLAYKWETALGAGGQYLNNIYVAEADNKNGTTPVCLVVGGYYTGGSYGGEGLVDGTSTEDDYTLNYYRIDLTSTATEGTTLGGGAFDIIRNHSYIFNILSANSPGTSDPDPRRATAGLTVEILDYTEVPMHGINSQYTLNVNQSLFAFDGATTDVGELLVSTNGEGWDLVTEWAESEGYPEDGATDDWLHVTDTTGGNHSDSDDLVTIEPDANVNTNDVRNTSFFIKCGQVLKRINVVQDNTETGNSYIVEPGTYSLKIDVCGNGNTSAWTNDDGSQIENIGLNNVYSIDDVAYVDIIWETADGFVTIDDPYSFSESGCISYTVNNVKLDDFGDWTGYVFDPGNGANALIGVYSSDGNLLWSYHIWALGDYADGVLTEEWHVGSNGASYYNFMDRNLGAYSNLPGSKSFGLLYQWGRKDPFIGAYRENNERDFRQVRKQYTVHYEQPNNRTYVWSNFDDSSMSSEEYIDKYTIQNPTTILESGLLSSEHADATAHGLWGTTSYSYDTSETGNKTMYDPCPPGYRVPSLNALTIYDGHNDMWTITTQGAGPGGTSGNVQVEHSSYTARYVPIKEGDSYRTQANYTADFVSDAPFYGFWFDYSGAAGYENTYESDNAAGYGCTYYSEESLANGTCGWPTGYSNTNPGKPANITWLPLAGIYNGTANNFGRAGITDRMDDEPYLPASSLQVSSVLWANSPTSTNEDYPAGLLMHGTEGAYAPLQDVNDETSTYQYSPGTADGNGGGSGTSDTVATEGTGYWTTATTGYSTVASGWWTGSVDANKSSMDSGIATGTWNASAGNENILDYNNWTDQNGLEGSGRHFHSFADPTISTLANPSYAASVRCIRDKDAITHIDDVIYNFDGTVYDGTNLDLYLYEEGESQDYIELAIFFVEEWEVVSPGAKWVSVSPSSGTTTSSSGDYSVIRITYNTSVGVPEEGTTASILITFARGDTATINITYVGGTRGN